MLRCEKCVVGHDIAVSGCFKAGSHIACRAHAVSLPCYAAKGLECVFPI